MPTFEDFKKLNIRVGKILEVEDFPEMRKPAYKLKIDFGSEGIKRSAAQLPRWYKKEDLVGRTVVAVLGFPPKQIANFVSECLVLGALKEDGEVVLLQPDKEVKAGLGVA